MENGLMPLMSIGFILMIKRKKMEKFRKLKSVFGNLEFKIEEDNPEVGWYLYVYKNNHCIADYLQDTLEKAKEFAEEKYNVPYNSWEEETE
jgi:hypothetical protein